MSAPRPIRVLLIGPSMKILGGQSVQIEQVLKHVGARPEIDIQFQWMNAPLPAPFRDIRFLRTVLAWLVYVPVLFARAWRYDVLHAFTAAYWGYYIWVLPALLAAKLFRKKFLLHYHDGQARAHLEHWRWALPTMRRVDALVSPSRFLVDVFADFGLRSHAVYNIIDNERYTFRSRKPLRPVILHNRSFEPLYNIPCTLRAFARVQAVYPDAELTLAHDGPDRAALEHLAHELGLRHCRFVGRVAHHEIAGLYDAADIYITTPNIDNMPVSLLECAASGLPIVATRAGGIPYLMTDEEDALLVPIDDDEAAANACLRLLRDPALVERLTRNAYERVQAYVGSEVAASWVPVYRAVLSGDTLRP
ncbi:MAG: glycosyltransferase family 4 protein [Cytophagaceae bacterium]|nr:glycosyltransferase family 4 protein [Gemmatimonadaceae bacterium]